jgi:hypothetical protein
MMEVEGMIQKWKPCGRERREADPRQRSWFEIPNTTGKRCPGCGVLPGQLHAPWCSCLRDSMQKEPFRVTSENSIT